jgi:peptidyl-prolyl cis-trans isomerase D
MISLFRQFTKSWVFVGLMALLILSFAIFGMSDALGGGSTNNVVEAGDRVVSANDFKKLIDDNKQKWAEERNGQAVTNEELVAENVHVTIVEQLANQQSIGAWFDKLRIKPSPKLIVDQLAQQPQFVNPTTGKFDRDTYLQALSRFGVDQKTVEREVAADLANRQFITAALAGFQTPRVFATAEAAFSMQTRDFSYFYVTEKSITAPPAPTDAEINTFYQENLARLTSPELRQASIVILSVEQFLPGVQVNDADVRKAYEARLESARTPETRSFIQITAPDAKAANAISAALKSGQSPDAVAKANKGTLLRLDRQTKAAVPDAKIADAAFAMKSGEVSGPIQGELSVAVIRMGDIHVGATPSFESMRAQIVEDLKRETAANKLNEASHKLADALAAGEEFNATAQKLGLKVEDLEWMTAEGRSQGQDYSRFPKIVKTVYDLQPGSTSDIQEFGQGQYFVVNLKAVRPAAAPPLEAVKPKLIEAWRAQKAVAAIEEKAEALAARLDKGESLATLAAEAASPLQTEKAVDRSGGAKQVPPTITGPVFGAKPGQSFHVPLANGAAVLVGRLDAVHQAQPAAANTTAAALRTRMGMSVAQDVVGLARTAARKAVKVKTYPNIAIRALGVTPPAADAKSDTKKDAAKS